MDFVVYMVLGIVLWFLVDTMSRPSPAENSRTFGLGPRHSSRTAYSMTGTLSQSGMYWSSARTKTKEIGELIFGDTLKELQGVQERSREHIADMIRSNPGAVIHSPSGVTATTGKAVTEEDVVRISKNKMANQVNDLTDRMTHNGKYEGLLSNDEFEDTWKRTIIGNELPLMEFGWDYLTVLLSAEEETKEEEYTIRQVDVLRIGKHPTDPTVLEEKEEKRFLAAHESKGGTKVSGLGNTKQEAIDEVLRKQEDLIIKQMDLE